MNPFPRSKGIVIPAKRLESAAQNLKNAGMEYLGQYIQEPRTA